MRNIFEAKNLVFKDIIKYPHIQIKKNKTTFITGKSGCGKSTLLKLFNATVSKGLGEISYKGEEISKIDTIKLRREVILVSQNVFLFDCTIEENYKKYYEYRESKLPVKEHMEEYLKICDANFKLSKKCQDMSGGEKQRVFLAICMSFKPKVLMLDEPTSALDENTAYSFFTNIKKWALDNSITLIVVSHNAKLVEECADEKLLLEKVG